MTLLILNSAVPCTAVDSSCDEFIQNDPQYLVLGDSISTGYKLGGGHFTEESFAKTLSSANGYEVAVEAVDGNTASGLLKQLEEGTLDDVIVSADIITITCGGNDMLAFLYEYLNNRIIEVEKVITDTLYEINRYLGIANEAIKTETEVIEKDSASEDGEEQEDTAPPESEAPEETVSTPSENETAFPSGVLSKLILANIYDLFEEFITNVNNTIDYIGEKKKNASFWEKLILIAYEELIDYSLDAAESLLISFTKTGEYQEAVNAYIEKINDVIDYIRSLNGDAVIILATQYNPYSHFSSPAHKVISNFVDAGVCKLNEAITLNASDGKYFLADVYTAFDSSDEVLCNAAESPLEMDVHPNAAGHAVIAECMRKTLAQIQESMTD